MLTLPRPRPWAVAVAAAALGLLILAACSEPGIEMATTGSPVEVPTAAATLVRVPTAEVPCIGEVAPGEPCRCTFDLLEDDQEFLATIRMLVDEYEDQLINTIPGVFTVGASRVVEEDPFNVPYRIYVGSDKKEFFGMIPDFIEGCPVRKDFAGKVTFESEVE